MQITLLEQRYKTALIVDEKTSRKFGIIYKRTFRGPSLLHLVFSVLSKLWTHSHFS